MNHKQCETCTKNKEIWCFRCRRVWREKKRQKKDKKIHCIPTITDWDDTLSFEENVKRLP